MIITCIDDRGSRKLLRTGNEYEATIDPSKPTKFRIEFNREDFDKQGISKKTPTVRYFKKSRFIVIKK